MGKNWPGEGFFRHASAVYFLCAGLHINKPADRSCGFIYVQGCVKSSLFDYGWLHLGIIFTYQPFEQQAGQDPAGKIVKADHFFYIPA